MHICSDVCVCEYIHIHNAHTYPRDLLRVDPKRRTQVRIITVDADVHMRIAAGTGVTFLEFVAKNVGARRARGRCVLFSGLPVV